MNKLAALAVLVATLALVPVAQAKMPRRHDPATFVERGASVLLWLDTHRQFGTARSRAIVRRDHLWLVTDGLRRAGVLSPLLCIHGGEGSWRSETGNGYHGGLQADDSFQWSYGAQFARLWGSAGHWPPWAQLVMGYRAWRVRGFSPWPVTARNCGLL